MELSSYWPRPFSIKNFYKRQVILFSHWNCADWDLQRSGEAQSTKAPCQGLLDSVPSLSTEPPSGTSRPLEPIWPSLPSADRQLSLFLLASCIQSRSWPGGVARGVIYRTRQETPLVCSSVCGHGAGRGLGSLLHCHRVAAVSGSPGSCRTVGHDSLDLFLFWTRHNLKIKCTPLTRQIEMECSSLHSLSAS